MEPEKGKQEKEKETQQGQSQSALQVNKYNNLFFIFFISIITPYIQIIDSKELFLIY